MTSKPSTPATTRTKKAPRSKTATSTPRLSEYARAFVYPEGITKTVWTRVEAKGRELGLGFDWWQSQLGTVCLGYGEDGKYVATIGGIGLSIPRQVGKTYFVLAMLVILCILFPGLQVVWTAHHLRTSTKTFTTLRGLARRKKIAPHIRSIRAANGEQEVDFVNGSKIMFGARAQGFGRGFDEIDVEVFDEAQILDTKALEDMIAATNQARHEHGALLFYMGTPPRPSDPSEAFTERRSEAIRGESEDSIWLEIGAEPHSDPNDRTQWPGMNPSYPTRTPLESMLRLRKNLKDDDSWNREGRGIWDDVDGSAIFSPGSWGACAVQVEPIPTALAVASDVDGVHLSLAAASSGEIAHLGAVLRCRVDRERAHFVSQVARIQRERNCVVVIDKRGPASFLIDDLVDAGVNLTLASVDDFIQSCADLCDDVENRRVTHCSYAELDDAVNAAGWRYIGDRRVFARKKGDIAMLEAAALARWGARSIAYDLSESVY